jgi:hypothetical protein
MTRGESTNKSANNSDIYSAIYSALVQKYNTELTMFWMRANFFLLINAGLFSVAISLFSRNSPSDRVLNLTLLICGVGFLLAWVWLLVMHVAYIWINTWRDRVLQLEATLEKQLEATSDDRTHPWKSAYDTVVFPNHWPFTRQWGRRPAYVTRWLPWMFIGIWAFLLILIIPAVIIAPPPNS